MWRGILISSFSWSNVSRAVHSYSWDANFYLFSLTAHLMLAELECLPIDEIMRPDKSDGPNSHCCSCVLVWNSVKDYWERLYGSVVYSITKLLIGMLLSVASPKSVRAQGSTFTFVVGKFWGLCSVFIIPGMPVRIRASNLLIGASFTDVRHLEDTNTRNEEWKNKNAIDYLEAS